MMLLNMHHIDRKRVRRLYFACLSLQAFNWLLRSVAQQTCLHDLLWFLVVSLMPGMEEEEEVAGENAEGDKEEKKKEKKDQEVKKS